MKHTGLDVEKVYDLPLDVFEMYSEAALKEEARNSVDYIQNTAMSVYMVFSEAKQQKKHLEKLRALSEED